MDVDSLNPFALSGDANADSATNGQGVADALPSVLSSMTDGFQLLDREARYVRFNAAAREIYKAQGLDVDALIGRNIFEVFPDLGGTDNGKMLRRALGGQNGDLEFFYSPWASWFSLRYHAMPDGGVAVFFLDITAKKQAEKALHDSEQLYRALVEVSPQIVWYGRADGYITFVNQHWLSYSGFTAEESLGSGWANAIDPTHREGILAEWIKAAAAGRWEFEIPFRRRDGVYRWHLARGLALRDAEGNVERWIGVAVDIHERKSTEEALRTSEEKYRTLFDSMDEGYCVIDVLFDEQGQPNDWRFVETNPAFNEQNPIPGMAIGRTMTEMVPAIEPKWFDIYGRVAVTGEPLRFTEHSAALNRWFDLYAFRIGGADSRRVAVLFSNITQRKLAERALQESEMRFRALATASTSAFYRMDPHWERVIELDGRSFLEDTTAPRLDWRNTYLLPEDQPQVMAAIEKAMATRTILEMEHRVRRADGSIGWTATRAVPVLASDGSVTEWFGTASDITDRKLGEETLRKTEKLAVVGRLAATISHEINNPLEAVTNLLYLIQTEAERQTPNLTELCGYVQTAQQELSRVSHVVTNTLQFNRQSTAATRESLSSLIESALGIYEGRLRVSDIRLQKRYDSRDAVLCYASELRQVFTNLIGNAFDATKQGGVLELRTRRRAHWSTGRPGVSVLIQDTGVGMSGETLKHLFEPFFTTKGIHGTGLGLWVSKSILDKHCARFRVRSSQDSGRSGTCWYLWFPEQAAF